MLFSSAMKRYTVTSVTFCLAGWRRTAPHSVSSAYSLCRTRQRKTRVARVANNGAECTFRRHQLPTAVRNVSQRRTSVTYSHFIIQTAHSVGVFSGWTPGRDWDERLRIPEIPQNTDSMSRRVSCKHSNTHKAMLTPSRYSSRREGAGFARMNSM